VYYRPAAMTSMIGKVTGAVGAFSNENSLALANIRLDFSLVKLEAPKEFNQLALAISPKRKYEAEDGALHRTARRLGALFEQSLPATQELFRAYGKRVSEISLMPTVNPRPSDHDNIFASHIGLDVASIWAAVTSGTGAIAAHLLACMLARTFTSSEATSVWVEIVEKQKEHLFKKRDEDLFNERHDSLTFAAMQEISRNDLTKWDASARAWLQSADQAKARQHKQMMLILNNARIPVNGEPDTYKSVMKAWVTALKAMECLVNGMPQQVQDGAALLGISSWHLYPDILLFGDSTADIKQKDPIFEGTSVLTLGLELAQGLDKSVSWSLPLARLQYYGDPVQTSRSTGYDNSRITPHQFSYIVMGCVFEAWGAFGVVSETAVAWLNTIMALIKQPLSDEMSNRRPQHHDLLWLEYLDVTTQRFVHCDGLDKQLAMQLVSFGRRKSTFLYPLKQQPIPLFGLSHLSNLIPMLQSHELRLEQLRKVACRVKLPRKSFIIKYKPSQSPFTFEYTTVRPMRIDATTQNDTEKTHVYWLPITLTELVELCCKRDSPYFRTTSPIWQRHDCLIEQGNLCFPVIKRELRRRNMSASYPNLGYLTKHDFMTTAMSLHSKWLRKRWSDNNFQSVLVAGTDEAAIFQIGPSNLTFSGQLEPEDIIEGAFTPKKIDVAKVLSFLINKPDRRELVPLKACTAISNVYMLLPQATISTLVLSQNLSEAKWIQKEVFDEPIPTLSRQQAFACVAMFETGTCNLDPLSLTEVFAISSGNSIFVSSTLLVDPYEQPRPADIRRMVGNIGRAGLSLLVPPLRTKIRSTKLENWKEINHSPFDGTAEDCFRNTSIHLSFTEYEMPLATTQTNHHTIDRPINLIESLISVYDRGKWVADLDILKAFSPDRAPPSIHRQTCDCTSILSEERKEQSTQQVRPTFLEVAKSFPRLRSTSIDNWEELLDPPTTGTIAIRAHGNWLARLALTAVCVNFEFRIIILGKEACWSCCAMEIDPSKKNMPAVNVTRYKVTTLEDKSDLSSDSSSGNQEPGSTKIGSDAEDDSDSSNDSSSEDQEAESTNTGNDADDDNNSTSDFNSEDQRPILIKRGSDDEDDGNSQDSEDDLSNLIEIVEECITEEPECDHRRIVLIF